MKQIVYFSYVVISLAFISILSSCTKKIDRIEPSWTDYNSVIDVFDYFDNNYEAGDKHDGDTLKVWGWLCDFTYEDNLRFLTYDSSLRKADAKVFDFHPHYPFVALKGDIPQQCTKQMYVTGIVQQWDFFLERWNIVLETIAIDSL